MSTNVARTSDGWWVEQAGRLTKIETAAVTTAELLADRPAVHAAVATPDPAGPLVSEASLLSPVTTPARVVAQMANYRSHAIDAGLSPDHVPAAFFRKASGSVVGPDSDIVCPPHVGFLDYEVELGIVLGRRLEIGDTVTDENLADYIAAYVITNDVSARDVQLTRTQFYEAKSYPTFTPVGPFLTLVDEGDLAALANLRLTLSVNGEVRQDETAADMLVGPVRALNLLARFQVLDAGDLVLTGTPGGTALRAPAKIVEKIGALLPAKKKWELFFKKQASNPRWLKDGDTVVTAITDVSRGIDLGVQHNVVRKSAG